MKTKEIKSDKLKRIYEVSFSAQEIASEVEGTLVKLSSTMRLDGFRPGKIPLPVVRQRYGEKAHQDALSDMIQRATDSLVKEHGLSLAVKPAYDVKTQEEGKDFVLEITFEILPKIDPIALDSLKFDHYKVAVLDKDVDQSVQELAERFYETAPLEKKRKSQEGDVLVIDFKGTVEGEPFEGGSAKGYRLALGSKSFIPGFEDQLIGKEEGKEVTVTVTFPENYTKPLAGKEAKFFVTIHEILEKKPRNIDDEFSKKLGFDNVESLREFLKGSLESERNQMSYEYAKQDILELLSKKISVDLPEAMVNSEYHAICHRLHDHECQDEHHEACGGEDFQKKCEEWRKEYFPIAERRVKLGLVLASISNTEGIRVRNKELEDAIVKEAQRYQGQEKKVIDYYKNNPQAIEALRAPLLEEKVIRHILEKASVTEKDVSLEAFQKMQEKREEELENAYRD